MQAKTQLVERVAKLLRTPFPAQVYKTQMHARASEV